MVYKLKKYDTFQITGRGTVFALHRGVNGIEGIPEVGDSVIGTDDKEYEITGVETFRKSFNIIGDNVGLIVKEKMP